MARYNAVVEAAAATAASASPGTAFANIVAAASVGFKLRRITIGVRTTAAVVPTSQQATVGLVRATARGTQTATTAGNKLDPNTAASGITGIDTTWSANPTLAAAPNYEVSFNLQSGVDLPWELLEEFICATGTANGIALTNIGAYNLPAGHFITASLEWEE